MQVVEGQVRLTASEFADLTPSRPILSSNGPGWSDVTLQHFKHSPNTHTFPATSGHRFSLHLSGPMLFETKCDGRHVKHWSDSGQSFIRPAGVPVVRSQIGKPETIVVHITPRLVDDIVIQAFDRDPAHVSLTECTGIRDSTLDKLGRLLLAEAQGSAYGTRLMVEMLANALATQLLRCHSSLAPKIRQQLAGLPSGRLRRVIEHMHEFMDQDLSLGQLADVAGLGTAQFARAFRIATGEPPHRYLTRLRIERARELLEQTEQRVVEVGLNCGFEQPSHFATAFRKVTGLSPRAWRAHRRL